MMHRARRALAVCATLAVTLGGCEDDPPGPRVPATLRITGGDRQSDTVEAALPMPLEVQVLDARGRALPGVGVSWRPMTAAGSVSPVTTVTDVNGTARALWTVGPATGVQQVIASAGDLVVVFRATVGSGAPARATDVSGGWDSALYGALLPVPRVVRVVDRLGNPVTGATVEWLVAAGGGTLMPKARVLDADGRAAADWRLGPVPGQNTAMVTVGGNFSYTLHATGLGYHSLAVGGQHSCALTTAGVAYCWGANSFSGALGDGSGRAGAGRSSPVAVLPPT